MATTPITTPQTQITAAFQGEPGAYSEQAAIQFFGKSVRTLPCQAFEGIFSSIESGQVTHGLLPIENSLTGSIHQNYDLLLKHNLNIIGEYHLRVSHCLLALPGVKIEEIRHVYSHPQALMQCEANLNRLGLEKVVDADTAGSARLIRDKKDRQAAALASAHAGEVYGLDVLVREMEDNPANFTRFLVISKQGHVEYEPEGQTYKTTIVFSVPNVPGSLFKAMSVFALRDIDLSKIESRPIPGKPWEYLFYIDFIGHADMKNCARALDHLGEIAELLLVLGSYPRQKQE
jgi:arogenate/prephenate dehydratase